MIKSVLCAIDVADAEIDKPVLIRAAKLAELEGASLDVLTVVPDYGMSVVGSHFDKDHTKAAVKKARELLVEMGDAVLGAEANAKVRHVVGIGKAYEEILKTAEIADSDLIVIGAHQPELASYLLGPNAARVVRHSSCSVYVVR